MRPIALALLLRLPDRLPSLLVLAGFWIPPAIAGWLAAGALRPGYARRAAVASALLATFVLAYAAAWYRFNLWRMPPYIPGAVADPTIASPAAMRGLAVFTCTVVLPGSAIACALAFRRRGRTRRRTPS